MSKKQKNHFTKKDFLSENSNECTVCVKNSFDPNAIPKEPKAYLQLVSLKLEHRDDGLTKVPLWYTDAASVTNPETWTDFEIVPAILSESEITYYRRV